MITSDSKIKSGYFNHVSSRNSVNDEKSTDNPTNSNNDGAALFFLKPSSDSPLSYRRQLQILIA